MKFVLTTLLLITSAISLCERAEAQIDADILFVTQPPLPADFATVNAVFANHQADPDVATRGGDLYIRYKDGSLKNLTAEAGFGGSGLLTGTKGISVRDPAVHWGGTKALFSMVIGAPQTRYQVNSYYWQIYEVTGLGKNETPIITKIANQPAQFNNVMPIYDSEDRIIFVTDRPRNGARHLYPQRDEYESTASNTGIWRLDPISGDLIQLDHSPSGDFNPIVDSFGRVIFTRWDHLQRDQQADGSVGDAYGGFNFSSEAENAVRINSRLEVFPEPRSAVDQVPNTELHTFNHFFPWMVDQDGHNLETLNHIGRHELHEYFNRSFNDDPNLDEFIDSISGRNNQSSLLNFLNIREDPLKPGTYFGVNAPEFRTHSAGAIVSIDGPPGKNPDLMWVTYHTHPDTSSTADDFRPNHSGLYRNPLPLSDGSLIATHTISTREDENEGNRNNPISRYEFRLKTLKSSGLYKIADQSLTSGIVKSIQYWDPDELVSYTGPLWELSPVEIRARQRPSAPPTPLAPPEQAVFEEEGISLTELREYLMEHNLALIVSRDITTRDRSDKQQPFNLRIAHSEHKTTGATGKVYPVSSMQIFQGDQIRGYGGVSDPQEGRRVLATPLHDATSFNPPDPSADPSRVLLGADGSMAAFVPARRALTWQLTDAEGEGVVRERYWLTFGRGEIRVCGSCHGVNTQDQAGHAEPQNKPLALRNLLRHWKNLPPLPPAPGETPVVDDPDDQAPEPEFELSVSGSLDPRKTVKNIQSGKAIRVSIDGTNEAAFNQQFEITLRVNGKQCRSAIASGTTNSQGAAQFSGKFPKKTRAAQLRFGLRVNNQVLDTVQTRVIQKSRSRKLAAASTLCRSLKSALRAE